MAITSRPEPEAPQSERHLCFDRCVTTLVPLIASKLSKSEAAVYQRAFSINFTEWRILALLAIEPGIPASRVCHIVGVGKGSVSRTLGAMAKRGLITIRSDEKDGRAHAISLAVKGRLAHNKVIVCAHAHEQRLLSSLSACERQALIDLLHRLREHLVGVIGSASG